MQQQESHVTLSIEQFNLLMGEIRDLKSTIATIEAKTDNLHRIFNDKQPEKPVKKLSPKQQRAQDLKEEIEKEKAGVVIMLNQM